MSISQTFVLLLFIVFNANKLFSGRITILNKDISFFILY
jgi:hypothetical protein